MHKTLLLVAVSLTLGFAPSLAMAKNASAMVAESSTDQDTANIKTVKSFIAAWNDAGRGVDYLSSAISFRMEEDKPMLVGRKAYLEGWAGLQPGQTMSVKFNEVYARNPVVVTLRSDDLKTPGKPDQIFEVVGVFIVKDGKIAEWTDFLHK